MLHKSIGVGQQTAAVNSIGQDQPPQTMRQYYDQCEKNFRDQLVMLQRAREKCDRLNLMDFPRDEVRQLIYFDHVF